MTWNGESRILNNLTGEAVENMLTTAGADYSVRRVPENAILFWSGEEHKLHYFVVEGLIELYADDAEGRRKTIDFYGPGSFFSYMFLSEGNQAMTTARACVNSKVIALTKTAFFTALHNSPNFAEATVKSLFELLQMQTNEVIRASFYSVTRRCALLLVSLAQGHAATCRARIDKRPSAGAGSRQHQQDEHGLPSLLPYDNTALADMLGASRNSVSAAVTQLQKQGVVRKQRTGIEIMDLAALERIGRTGRAS